MGIWYREFYSTNAEGEEAMRAALHDADPAIAKENRDDIQKRFNEVKDIPEERCVVSSEQRRFIQRMLAEE